MATTPVARIGSRPEGASLAIDPVLRQRAGPRSGFPL